MAKPPRIRHSQTSRDPVTIDLDAKDVVRGDATKGDTAGEAGAKAADKPATTPTPAATGTSATMAHATKPQTPSGGRLLDEHPVTGAKPTDGPLTGPTAAAAAKSTASSSTKREDAPPAKPSDASKPFDGPIGAKSVDAAKPNFGREQPQPTGKVEPRTEKAAPVASAPIAPKAPPPRRGGLSAVAAGLIGGVVALAGAGALQYAGVLLFPGNAGDASAVAALQADVEALKAQPAAAAPADTTAVTELSGRVDALAADIEQLKAASAGAGGSAPPADTQAIEARFAALESAIGALPQGGGDTAALTERLATLEAGLAAATQSAQQQSSTAEAANTEMGARIARLEETVGGLAGTVAEQAEQPNAALAISASSLKAAIDRGDPFMTELETFAAISPQAAEIEPLRGMAASGVPSRTAIAAGFPDAAAAMIAAARPVNPDAGILDRLMNSAQSLVQVRPVGMVEGVDVPAILARMEVAVTKGDYAAALAEYDSLPEAAKTAGAAYIADVRARLAADELTSKVLATALKA